MCPEDSLPENESQASPRVGRDVEYPLLPLLGEASQEVLRALGPALEQAMPLKPKHREDLPLAVRDLSAQLTTERSGLSGGYLQTPRTLAAYAHYFMPWNVFRQARIMAGQWLRLHSGAQILDLGAGPLTGVLALWTARPDLREKELHFVCVDRARKAMRLGLDVFRELAGESGKNWRVEMVDQALELYLRRRGPGVDLVLMGNVLNELRWPNVLPLEESVAELAGRVLGRMNLERQAHLLLVEPGTRFGGKIVALFRKACLEQGLMSLSPCVHQLACPMLERGAQSWCHFRFDTSGVPPWLAELSRQARLPKETLAVSFAHLAAVRAKQEGKARVISAAIRLPERGSSGYYACTGQGLVLLETDRASLRTGELVEYSLQPGGQRDRKSGALMGQLSPDFEESLARRENKEPVDKPPPRRQEVTREKKRDAGPGSQAGERKDKRRRFAGASGRDAVEKAPRRGATRRENGGGQGGRGPGKKRKSRGGGGDSGS